jgi:type IV pilus assembly protein PilE
VTLLELLVTLALVGVLAGLAYPSYRAHLLRAHRIEAIEALLAIAAAQERFHLQHGRYADGFEPEVTPGLAVPPLTTGGRYQVRISSPAPAQYAARAAPHPGSGQDQDRRCSEFGLDDSGRRWAADSLGQDSTEACWR